MLVIVPNSVADAINKKLDAVYAEIPDAAVDREHHYQALLDYFYEHGVIPDFKLVERRE